MVRNSNRHWYWIDLLSDFELVAVTQSYAIRTARDRTNGACALGTDNACALASLDNLPFSIVASAQRRSPATPRALTCSRILCLSSIGAFSAI